MLQLFLIDVAPSFGNRLVGDRSAVRELVDITEICKDFKPLFSAITSYKSDDAIGS
jgi:hypothetical protein